MALSRSLVAFLFLSLVVLDLIGAYTEMIITNPVDEAPPPGIDCVAECDRRCQLSSRPKLCKRACGTCCARCGCVPPGTAGNYDVCPCYANMTTHGGRHKCP